jgi:hypothetical protein
MTEVALRLEMRAPTQTPQRGRPLGSPQPVEDIPTGSSLAGPETAPTAAA